MVRVLALFGLYAILGTRIVGLSQTATPTATMLVELAVFTVLFLIAAIFIFTRPARVPLE